MTNVKTSKEAIQRESIVFYLSFYKALEDIHEKEFENCIRAIFDYAFTGNEGHTEGIAKMFFEMAKAQIDSNNRKYVNSIKGARARWETKSCENEGTSHNNNADKSKHDAKVMPNVCQTDAKVMPNVNVNVNVNENDNDNVNENEHVNVNVNENENVNENVSENVNVYDNKNVKVNSDFKESTHTYGEYNNIILTEKQHKTLEETYGKELLNEHITLLSRYIKRKPDYKSGCHFEDLRGWVALAVQERDDKAKKESCQRKKEASLRSSGLADLNLDDIFEQ